MSKKCTTTKAAPSKGDKAPPDLPRCDACGCLRVDARLDAALKRVLCNLCWANTRPAVPPPKRFS